MKQIAWASLALLAVSCPSFAQTAAIDTTNNSIPIAVRGQTVASFDSNGMEIRGASGAAAPLDVHGEAKIGNTGLPCDASRGGTLRWTGSQMQLCDGNSWTDFGGSSGGEWYGPDGGYIPNQDIGNGTAYGSCTGPYHPYFSWNSPTPVITCHHN